MNRRTWILAATGLLLGERTVVAQTPVATPHTDDSLNLGEYVDIEGVNLATTRLARLLQFGFDDYMSGALAYLDCYVLRFDREEQISRSVQSLAVGYQSWARENQTYVIGDLKQASYRELGDQSWGWSADVTSPEEKLTGVWGMGVTRYDNVAQVLFGAAMTGNVLTRIADISELTIEHWDNANVSTALPELSDLEEGMTIEYTKEVTRMFSR